MSRDRAKAEWRPVHRRCWDRVRRKLPLFILGAMAVQVAAGFIGH